MDLSFLLFRLAMAKVFKYIVGVVMEKLFHGKDYSNQGFQFQGNPEAVSSLSSKGLKAICRRLKK